MIKLFKNFKNKKGSFLIESIVSVSLVVIGLLGILALVTKSISLNNNVHGRFIAASLAAEGIEVVKNIIDTNIAQGFEWDRGINNGNYSVDYNSAILGEIQPNGCGEYLCFDSNSKVYSHSGGGNPSVFKRSVRVAKNSNEIQVNSIVSWLVKGALSTINVEDRFYNWRQ
jgi:hypothetical protein